jgi:hypothetical protein
MTYLSLKKWSGAFEVPGVIEKIRRVIHAQVEMQQCICVTDDDAKGITPEVRRAIERDMPPEKVRFSRMHPTLGGGPEKKRRR